MTKAAELAALVGSSVTEAAVVGEVKYFAGASAPEHWLVCDGSAISRTTYAELFSVIGTTFGAGNGSTTFNVPDARGRALIGVGQGSTAEGGGAGTNRTLGAAGGAETHTLALSELAAHSHTAASLASTAAGTQVGWDTQDGNVTFGDTYDSAPTQSQGGGGAHNNMGPFLALNVIVYAGV